MIPKLHYTSQAQSTAAHLENIQKACSSGAELVQLDLEHIAGKDHLKLAQEVNKNYRAFSNQISYQIPIIKLPTRSKQTVLSGTK